MWLKAEGFVERVQQWWNSYYFQGSLSCHISWMSCVLDGLVEERERALCEDKVIENLERATTLEEISWSQKSRALWLRDGDKCTKSFH
jgi:hypothetical protein